MTTATPIPLYRERKHAGLIMIADAADVPCNRGLNLPTGIHLQAYTSEEQAAADGVQRVAVCKIVGYRNVTVTENQDGDTAELPIVKDRYGADVSKRAITASEVVMFAVVAGCFLTLIAVAVMQKS